MSPSILPTYLFHTVLALSIICSVIANAKVRPEHRDAFRVFFWRERSEFSEKGWKFRQAAACLGALAVALLLLSKVMQFLEAH